MGELLKNALQAAEDLQASWKLHRGAQDLII